MSISVPVDARAGFWVAVGVLAGMVAFHFVYGRISKVL